MLNFRVPLNVYYLKLQHCKQCSSDITMKMNELKNQVPDRGQIKKGQVKYMLPYLQKINIESFDDCKSPESVAVIMKESDSMLLETSHFSLNNVEKDNLRESINFCSKIEMENTVLNTQISSTENLYRKSNELLEKQDIFTDQRVLETDNPQQQSADLVPVTKKDASGNFSDLSTAGLPLSLHCAEGSFLMSVVAQDVNQFYSNMANKMDVVKLQVTNHERQLTEAVNKWADRPGPLQNMLKQQVSALTVYTDKTALWLCEKVPTKPKAEDKKPVTIGSTSESAIDKIKKLIEGILATFKKKVDEQKKKSEDDKKKKSEEDKKKKS